MILINEKIGYVNLYGLGTKGSYYLTMARWNNLKRLNLSIKWIYLGKNWIRDEGCKLLAGGKWENLEHLSLCIVIIYKDANEIGPEGCKHFSKWTNLTYLNLG